MIGLQARDPGNAGIADEHASSEGYPRIDAAGFLEAQHAGILDLRDDETDFVHVRGDHQLRRVVLSALLEHDQVAHGVHGHLVRVGAALLRQLRTDGGLETGDAVRQTQFFQQS